MQVGKRSFLDKLPQQQQQHMIEHGAAQGPNCQLRKYLSYKGIKVSLTSQQCVDCHLPRHMEHGWESFLLFTCIQTLLGQVYIYSYADTV